MDKSLAIYVVSCHLDKKQDGEVVSSAYEIGIQAGAALTDKRTQSINDYDGFDDSISDRNGRYCECTAIYWVYKHITTDYVGIEHYRRRFQLSDEQLKGFMDEGVDIITTPQAIFDETIETHYCQKHYKYDWELLMEAIERLSPEYKEYADKFFSGKYLFPFNMSIMKAELFREYGEWMFKILDEVYKSSPEKTDRYQHRDMGFLAERLTSLFVYKKMCEGAKVMSARVYIFKSKEWEPEDECDFKDADTVIDACSRLYENNKIRNMGVVAINALTKYRIDNEDIRVICSLIYTATLERQNVSQTLYEYLPYELRKSLSALIETYTTLVDVIIALNRVRNDEMCDICKEYLSVTGFSAIAIINICKENGIDANEIFEILGVK